jgi:hypothetical protein
MRDLVIFVKDYEKIIRISEGNGCNLTTEDIDEGYVDYIYYDVFDAQDFQDVEDGGMVLTEKPIKEEFVSVKEAVERVLAMAGWIEPHTVNWIPLSGEDEWMTLIEKEEV